MTQACVARKDRRVILQAPHPGPCPLLATVDPEEYGLSKDILLLNCIKDLQKNTQILSVHFGEFAH